MSRMKLLLGYGLWGNKFSGIRDTYEYRGIQDTCMVGMTVFNEREIALHADLWATKIFIGIYGP